MSNITVRARLPMPPGLSVTPSQWRVLTDAIFPSAKTPEAIALALDYCSARRLDPFKRSVHVVPMWNSTLSREVETVWPGINELQVTAARTGQWAGMDEPRWGPIKKRTFKGRIGRGGNQRDVEVTLDYPEWCAVTVYRMLGGERHAFTEPVYWEESYSRHGRTEVPNEMWQKRVRGQLHKNAKAASLRAAFPEEMGNDYTAEEMEGKEVESGGIVIDGVAEPSTAEVLGDTIPHMDAPQPKRQTSKEWLDELEEELKHACAQAEDKDLVDAILARPKVHQMQDWLTNGAKDRLQRMIADAIRSTSLPPSGDPPDMDGEAEYVNDPANEAV